MLFFLLGCAIAFSSSLFAKVRLLTFHYNKPDYVELQYKTFKKFMLDDYELIVFNDAKIPELEKAIRETCEKHNIQCVRYEQAWHKVDPLNDQVLTWLHDPRIRSHIKFEEKSRECVTNNPSVRHSHVIQFALDNFAYHHDDIVGIIDGDCFPIRSISIKDLLGDHHIAGIQRFSLEDNIDYLWVPFIIFNPGKIQNKQDLRFYIDVIHHRLHDTGAHTYHFLNNNPEISFQKYPCYNSSGFYHWTDQQMEAFGFLKEEITLMRNLDSLKDYPWPITVEFHVQQCFLHLGGSSFDLVGHQDKEKCIYEFIQSRGVE